MNAKLASLLPQFEREAFRPQALLAHVSEEEARRRWGALAAFYKAGGHFLVTNGPYKLKSWTPESVTLRGVPRPDLSAGRWLLRRLRDPAPRFHHQGRSERRSPDAHRRHRNRREVPAQLQAGTHPAQVRSRHGIEPGRAGSAAT